MRWLLSAGYFGSWIIAAALLSFVLMTMIWGIADLSQLTGVDDDITLLALPVGGVLGAWGAVRARHSSVLHRVLSICGVSIAALGTLMTIWFLQRSGQVTGTGPFAGMGELVAAGMSMVVAVLGACMFGIWAFARLSK